MAIYNVYGTVTFTKFLGTVESDDYGEALDLADDLANEDEAYLCHQCSLSLGDDFNNWETVEIEKKE